MRFRELVRISNEISDRKIYERIMTPVDYAKKIGTFNADDRSRQYPLHQEDLVKKAINDCFTKVHKLERTVKEKEKEIENLTRKLTRQWVLNIVLSFTVYGLWELVKFLVRLQMR